MLGTYIVHQLLQLKFSIHKFPIGIMPHGFAIGHYIKTMEVFVVGDRGREAAPCLTQA